MNHKSHINIKLKQQNKFTNHYYPMTIKFDNLLKISSDHDPYNVYIQYIHFPNIVLYIL